MSARLFGPPGLDDLEFDNRIVEMPMCEVSVDAGQAGDWYPMDLGQMGGPGRRAPEIGRRRLPGMDRPCAAT